jgi:hypothetical protein
MKLKFVATFASATLALPVLVACTTTVAQKAPTPVAKTAETGVTYRTHIAPLLKAQCAECHGDDAPTLAEFKLNEEGYKKDKLGPRTDTYADLLQIVAYPDHGALMRRLDDGTNTPDKKPGNMYKRLGETEAERAANLKMIKAWVGEGAWNLNRWKAKGDVPGITKEQLDKLKLKY